MKFWIMGLLPMISGCTILVSSLGLGSSLVPAAQLADSVKLSVDIAAAATDKPTTTDRMASFLFDQECRASNVFQGRSYCERICR